MKPFIIEVKGSLFRSNHKHYQKKVLIVSQKILPDVGQKVAVCDPKLIDALKLLNSVFSELLQTRNEDIFQILRKHISRDQAAILTEVMQNVV